MEKASSNYEQTNIEISVALILVSAAISENIQVGMLKNIVPDPGQFDGDQIKFEDQWRSIRLFLKSNRVIETNNRITAILACLREDIAGIYAQRKLDKLDKELKTQDWEDFIKEIKIIFSDKMKAADAKWKIKSFKQGKKNAADFMIEFDILAIQMSYMPSFY